MNIPYVFKKCSKCGEWLVVNSVNFHKSKSGKYGLMSICKKCDKKRMRKYYKNNKKQILQNSKIYYENNKEQNKQYREIHKHQILEYQKQHYNHNKKQILERHKQYYATPQGQIAAFNGNCRRRIRKQNQGNGASPEQWLECMKFFGWKCAYSGENIGGNDSKSIRSLDHVVPLSKGGEHEIWNLVPMYKLYNIRKQDKDLLEWYKEQDFYSEDRLQKIYEWQEYAFNKWGDINVTRTIKGNIK